MYFPIALIVDVIYFFIKLKNDKTISLSKKIFSCIFICYITELVCLVLGLDLMINFWYKLLYHMNSGHSINWFNGDFDFTLDFINNIGIEIIGNFLMFYLLAFYILYLKKN